MRICDVTPLLGLGLSACLCRSLLKHSRPSDLQAVLTYLAAHLCTAQPPLAPVPPAGGVGQAEGATAAHVISAAGEHQVALLRCLLVALESEGGPRLMRALSASASTFIPILAQRVRAIAPHLQQSATTASAAASCVVQPGHPHSTPVVELNALASAAALCLRCLETMTARVQVFEAQHVHVPSVLAAAACVAQHLSPPDHPTSQGATAQGPGR